jgi:hypothetical protein
MSDFTVDISQNEYLPDGGEDVNASITVTSPDSGLPAPAADPGGRGDHHHRLFRVDEVTAAAHRAPPWRPGPRW